MMEYKVVPFTAVINQQKQTTNAVADQLEILIKKYQNEGWKYIRLECVSTFVQPDSGCFGFGARPGHITSYQMIVFGR